MATRKHIRDGVNIALGDSFSALAGRICRESWGNSPFVEVRDFSYGHFRGPRGFVLKNLPEGCYIGGAADGIGTKTILIDACGSYLFAACDVLAMTGADITRFGGKRLVFFNVIDFASLGEQGDKTNQACKDLMIGLGDRTKREGIVLLTGETAELGICVGSENSDARVKFNWAGVMLGVYHEDKMILCNTLSPGQSIIALRDGFRSNGISSVRKALRIKFGEEWFENPEAKESIQYAARPATLFDNLLEKLNGWDSTDFKPLIKPHAICHITGGGIKSKFAEDFLFPRGLSAVLDNLWEPPQIMRDCASWREMSDHECYSIWNGGQGALVVVDKSEVFNFINKADEFGIQAIECGTIRRQKIPSVTIKSKFSGESIVFKQ